MAIGPCTSNASTRTARVMSPWQVVDGEGEVSGVDGKTTTADSVDGKTGKTVQTEQKTTTTVSVDGKTGKTVKTVTEYYEQRTTVKVLDPTTDTKPKPDDSDDFIDPMTTITGGKMKGAHGVIKQINLKLLFCYDMCCHV